MANGTVPGGTTAETVTALLDSPQIDGLIEGLEALRETGRPGYGSRALVGACLIKSLYGLPTWSRTARLISEHERLRDALGGAPSQDAIYRFTKKLRSHRELLERCIGRVTEALREKLPEYGRDAAVDASDLPAYANGHKYRYKGGPERTSFSDPDAAWGHRSAVSTRKGGGFYGYKLHMAACSQTDLPLAWDVRPANEGDSSVAPDILDRLAGNGFNPETAAMDKGYDSRLIHEGCRDRGIMPVIPMKQGSWSEFPSCVHGEWYFAGTDRGATSASGDARPGGCKPASVWRKGTRNMPLIPRFTKR
ncbi:MAG: transposase [Actinomycetia bacterium]|nr:transposase [Actinomycetes bacterium]